MSIDNYGYMGTFALGSCADSYGRYFASGARAGQLDASNHDPHIWRPRGACDPVFCKAFQLGYDYAYARKLAGLRIHPGVYTTEQPFVRFEPNL